MLIDFLKETLSLYENQADYFSVRVTFIYDNIENPPKEIEKVLAGRPDFYAIGHRVDTPQQETVTIYIPNRHIVLNVGDYILVKHLGNGFSIYVAHLNTKQKIEIKTKKGKKELISQIDLSLPRPTFPQFTYRYSVGNIYNSSAVYLALIDAYKAKEPDYKYKYFVEFPSLNLYKRYYDVFDYDNRFASILDNQSEDLESRKRIFHFSHNPKIKDFLINLNKDPLFPFRPDPVFDPLHEKSATNKKDLLLEEEEKFDLTEEINIQNTDKYPLLDYKTKVAESKVFFTAYDEVINKKTPYETLIIQGEYYDIFYAQEFYELKLGRNKFGIYRLSKDDTFLLLKNSYDQQIALLKQKDLSQIRMRNLDGSSFLLENTPDYSRTILGTYPSLLFEEFYKNDYQHILLLNAEKGNFYSLQTNGSSMNDYSFLMLLSGNKDSSLKRTDFDYHYLSSAQTVAYGAKKFGSKGYVSLSVGGNSEYKTKLESNSVVELYISADDDLFKVTNSSGSNILSFKLKTFTLTNASKDISTIIDGTLTVEKNTTLNGSVTMNSGFTVIGSSTINGKIVACFGPNGIEPC